MFFVHRRASPALEGGTATKNSPGPGLRRSESVKGEGLVRIRWAAFLAYLCVSCVVVWLLGLSAFPSAIVGALSVGALSNILLLFFVRRSGAQTRIWCGAALSLDTALLAGLLYLYGGYTNPFSMMFLVYVTLAAFFLNARWTWWIFSLSLSLFVALFFFHVPLEQLSMHAMHGSPEGFSLHLHGMLIAFVVIGFLTSFFVARLARDLEERSEELARLAEREQEQKRLASLATLTAGAAHELATPIGTLTLIAEELQRDLAHEPHLQGELAVMQQELLRCEEVLGRMRAQSSELSGEAPVRAAVSEVLEGVRAALREGDDVEFGVDGPSEAAVKTLKGSLVSSLAALVRNGLQASPKGRPVRVTAKVLGDGVEFVVRDEGSGMSPEVLCRAGDPFFTTKDPGKGLGLGLFLVKSFASQVGGRFSVQSSAGSGTKASLFVPQEVAA